MQPLIHCAILYLLIGVMVLAFICAFVPPASLHTILSKKLLSFVIVQTTLLWPLLVWQTARRGDKNRARAKGSPGSKIPLH